ncbi:MAG: hypothetical protein IPI35_28530 [Deltaproteobacteria bacterium]|nr:hypothetical protein [Deltaproteobacteria bacterium]
MTLDGVAAVRGARRRERQVLSQAREDWLIARGVHLGGPASRPRSPPEKLCTSPGLDPRGRDGRTCSTWNEIDDLDELRRLRVRRADGQSVPLSRAGHRLRETYKERQVISTSTAKRPWEARRCLRRPTPTSSLWPGG